MNTLIIYDNAGYILSIQQGQPSPREPIGIPFLWVEIPQGQQLKITDGIGVDVSVEPHVPFLEDIPKTETELLKEKIQEQEEALMELANLVVEVLGQ